MRWLRVLLATPIAMMPTIAAAGRPLAVDDAGTVARRHFQMETGVGYVRDGSTKHIDASLTLSYGVIDTLQAGIGLGGQFEQRLEAAGESHDESGISDLVLNTKWNPLTGERFWGDHSLAATIKFPTADASRGMGSGETDYDLTYVFTKQLRDRVGVDFNLGVTWIGDDHDVAHYGLAGRWQAAEQVELVAEVFADSPIATDGGSRVATNAGVRWAASDGVVLDAAGGAGLRGAMPDWTATTGLTWTFGFGTAEAN